MKLSKVLSIFLYLYLLAVGALFAVNGKNYLVDAQSILLIVFIVFFMQWVLSSKDPKFEPLAVIFTGVIIFWYLLRFLFLLIYPEGIGFQDYFHLGVDEMNRSLVYLALGVVMTAVGFKIGTFAASLNRKPEYDAEKSTLAGISYKSLVVFTMAILGISLYNYLSFGIGRFGMSHGSWVFRFVSFKAIVLILIVFTGVRWSSLNGRQKNTLICLYGVIILYKIFMLSRASFYIIFTNLMFFLIAKYRNPIIRKRHVLLVTAFLVMSILTHSGITTARELWANASWRGTSMTMSETIRMLKFNSRVNFNDLNYLSFRMSALDRIMVIVNDKGDPTVIARYITLDNVKKIIISQSIPGNPYPGSMLTSQAFSMIYYGVPEWHIREGLAYTSLWTLYGILYAHFGWSGGLTAVFVITFALAFIYQKICQLRTTYNVLLRAWFLMTIYEWLLSYGLDGGVLEIYHTGLVGGLYLAILSAHSVGQKFIFKRSSIQPKSLS